MWKHLLAVAVLPLVIPCVWVPDACAQALKALEVQSPADDLPRPVDYVSDFAHVVSRRAVVELDRVCSHLDHSKADTQVAVVTIKSLDGGDVIDYATKLFNSWGVGRKATNRGVLILLSINDHKWRITVGRGLEAILPNSRAESIGQKMAPHLRTKDFDGAVKTAVREIAQAVSP